MPSRPKRKLDVQDIAVGLIDPNPWNPNVQAPGVQRAQRQSLEAYGFVDPVKVRQHPDDPERYQIVDGEHRFLDAKDLGDETVPAIILDLDDAAARKLTVILNETRGDADVAGLGKLLVELEEMGLSPEEVGLALPYSRSELDHLISLGREDWDAFEGVLPRDAGNEGHALTLHFPEGIYEDVNRWLALIEHETEQDRPSAAAEAIRRYAEELHGVGVPSS